MKKVVVRPERCVGCMQCMIACAVAHSRAGTLLGAIAESPLPKPRVHVGASISGRGFPNRCRHCDPAPCMAACLPGAISRDEATDSVLVDPARCIDCASCAMACPFGVIRFHEQAFAPPDKEVALKCDNCISRQEEGKVPACVEACKTGALVFAEPDEIQAKRTAEVAQAMVEGGSQPVGLPEGLELTWAIKRATAEMNRR